MNDYYVYAHTRNDNGQIFYIGKGKGKRAYIKSNRSLFWKRIVEKHGYSVMFLETGLEEEDAYKMEIIHIATQRKMGYCEANFSDGGDGVRVKVRWWNDKISKALIGKYRPKGKDNKGYKDIVDKETLFDMYVTKNMNTIQISNIIGLSIPTICNRLELYGIKKQGAGREKIKIQCIEDNKIFDSIMDAARYYSLYRENIQKVLSGKYKHTGNKTFKKI